MWTSLLAIPAVVGVMLVVKTSANACETKSNAKATYPVVAKSLQTRSELTAGALHRLAIAATISATQLKSLTGLQVANAVLSDNSQDRPLSPQANPTSGLPSVEELSNQNDQGINNSAISQMTSVSQMSDVQPSDWAFQAMRSLAERYGCISGYPNGTYRGERALTRFEFATGLNACLASIDKLIATATSDKFRQEDLATLQRLRAEFASELAILHGRVDALEANIAQLETHQFSVTTKLRASALFAAGSVLAGQNANGQKINRFPFFGDRAQLNFNTSFNGRDLLRVRIRARSLVSLSGTTTATPDGDLRFTGATFSTGAANTFV